VFVCLYDCSWWYDGLVVVEFILFCKLKKESRRIMKKVIFALVALVVCANAMEFKHGLNLPPVDNQHPVVINNTIVWVIVK
jgi:hypothetical protein